MTVCVSTSAAQLLRDAQDRVYRWPAAFTGFAARLRLSSGASLVDGTVWVTGSRGLALNLDDGAGEEEWEWGIEQLRSLVMHRWPQHDDDLDGSFGTDFADCSLDPAAGSGDGIVVVRDPMLSTFRIRDGHITEISRQLPTMRRWSGRSGSETRLPR